MPRRTSRRNHLTLIETRKSAPPPYLDGAGCDLEDADREGGKRRRMGAGGIAGTVMLMLVFAWACATAVNELLNLTAHTAVSLASAFGLG